MIVRPYTEADASPLERFIVGMQKHMCEIDPQQKTRPTEEFSVSAYVKNFLRKVRLQQGAIFLAEMKGTAVGCVVGIIKEATEEDLIDLFPFRHGRVIELFVDPAFRGMNIGNALLLHMEEYFRKQNCTRSELGCFATNDRALRLYRKAGYTDMSIDLYKML